MGRVWGRTLPAKRPLKLAASRTLPVEAPLTQPQNGALTGGDARGARGARARPMGAGYSSRGPRTGAETKLATDDAVTSSSMTAIVFIPARSTERGT